MRPPAQQSGLGELVYGVRSTFLMLGLNGHISTSTAYAPVPFSESSERMPTSQVLEIHIGDHLSAEADGVAPKILASSLKPGWEEVEGVRGREKRELGQFADEVRETEDSRSRNTQGPSSQYIAPMVGALERDSLASASWSLPQEHSGRYDCCGEPKINPAVLPEYGRRKEGASGFL